MRIYKSPKQEHHWILQPFRANFRGAGREEAISRKAKEHDFRYMCVYGEGDTLYAAYTSEKGNDFAARFLSYCTKAGIEDVIYVERKNDEQNVLVVVKNGDIKQDKVGSTSEIESAVESHINSHFNSENIEKVRFINYQFLENGFSEKISNKFSGKIENLSAALTDKLEPTEDFSFQKEKEALAKVKSRRPWLLYLVGVLAVLFIVNKIVSLSEPEQKVEVVVDPYAEFYAAMANDVIQPLNRMAQDYNIHVGLMTLPGWSVDKVTHTKGQVSYRMIPTERGDVKILERFASQNGMHVLLSKQEIVVLGLGANVESLKPDEVALYDVVELHHYLRDAINEYIPDSELTFLRDVPKGGSTKWVIRELNFQFSGIYKEDLMTLGAIAKHLPVSFGGDSADPNAGQYIVDKERFTGGLKISIYGGKR